MQFTTSSVSPRNRTFLLVVFKILETEGRSDLEKSHPLQGRGNQTCVLHHWHVLVGVFTKAFRKVQPAVFPSPVFFICGQKPNLGHV